MKIPCSSCNQRLEIPEELAGQTIECPACNASLAVPAMASPPPATAQVKEPAPQAVASKKSKSVIPKLAIAVTAVVLLVILGFRKPEPPKVLLYYCIQDGNVEAVKQHIKAGTDVNGKKGEGGVPLINAVTRNHKEIVELLIDAGADVNLKDREAPLHNVRNKEIAELLIAAGANVNAKDRRGWTPLYFARNKEIAELLIAKGANVNAKGANSEGSARTTLADGSPLGVEMRLDFETPLGWAIDNKRTKIADLLRKHGAKTAEELKAEEAK
jgi:ankyrin repeat protein